MTDKNEFQSSKDLTRSCKSKNSKDALKQSNYSALQKMKRGKKHDYNEKYALDKLNYLNYTQRRFSQRKNTPINLES